MFYYENLEVYKLAFTTNQIIYKFLKIRNYIPVYYKNQLGRASFSIMLNIAEGSGRTSSKDRRNFMVIARGSVLECSSIISFLFAEKDIPENLYKDLLSRYDELSKILYSMIKKLEEQK